MIFNENSKAYVNSKNKIFFRIHPKLKCMFVKFAFNDLGTKTFISLI